MSYTSPSLSARPKRVQIDSDIGPRTYLERACCRRNDTAEPGNLSGHDAVDQGLDGGTVESHGNVSPRIQWDRRATVHPISKVVWKADSRDSECEVTYRDGPFFSPFGSSLQVRTESVEAFEGIDLFVQDYIHEAIDRHGDGCSGTDITEYPRSARRRPGREAAPGASMRSSWRRLGCARRP